MPRAGPGTLPRPYRVRRLISAHLELAGDNGGVTDLAEVLARRGVRRGDPVGLAVATAGSFSVAADGAEWAVTPAAVADAERVVRPRWTVWSQHTATVLDGHGVRLATCWDIAAVHRLLFGGLRADPACAWACLHGQPPESVPRAVTGEPDLFSVRLSEAGPAGTRCGRRPDRGPAPAHQADRR